MDNLGNLEELVLLSVCSLSDDAYGVSVHRVLTEETGRQLTIGAIHTTLYRLQDKSYLSSEMGGATNERGGRRKRVFKVTGTGLAVLRESRSVRERFWGAIPALDVLPSLDSIAYVL
jgi:PadR family transcriptional regulator, regulatory protein PadR